MSTLVALLFLFALIALKVAVKCSSKTTGGNPVISYLEVEDKIKSIAYNYCVYEVTKSDLRVATYPSSDGKSSFTKRTGKVYLIRKPNGCFTNYSTSEEGQWIVLLEKSEKFRIRIDSINYKNNYIEILFEEVFEPGLKELKKETEVSVPSSNEIIRDEVTKVGIGGTIYAVTESRLFRQRLGTSGEVLEYVGELETKCAVEQKDLGYHHLVLYFGENLLTECRSAKIISFSEDVVTHRFRFVFTCGPIEHLKSKENTKEESAPAQPKKEMTPFGLAELIADKTFFSLPVSKACGLEQEFGPYVLCIGSRVIAKLSDNKEEAEKLLKAYKTMLEETIVCVLNSENK
jgi:hypothetical protein